MISKAKPMPVSGKQKRPRPKKRQLKSKPMALVSESRTWYKDQYRRSTMINLILSIVLAGSLSFNAAQLFLKTPPVYFAATSDLRILPMTPLDQPALTKSGVVDWASGVVRDTLTLNFLDFRTQLSAVKDNYFDEAYSGLLKSLEESSILPVIKNKRLNLKTTIPESPVITASGVLNGKFSYKIEFPAILSYESSNGVENTQHIIAKVLVQRVSATVNPKSVQIRQLILGYK